MYVYIDPRNDEEFYYGKGSGSRKEMHKKEATNSLIPNSDKLKRIKDIQNENLEPIVRVIARNLEEKEAFLVEKTLLWKFGHHLTNLSGGLFSDNFRPPDSMDVELSGFDFQNNVYYFLVGENEHRNWDDFVKYGFISNGQDQKYRDAMKSFNEGDVIAAYLSGHGYIGIGRIKQTAKPIREIMINSTPLLNCELCAENMGNYKESDEKCEYVALVDWIKTTSRQDAKFKSKSELFSQPITRCSLDGQPKTIEFLNAEFGVDIYDMIK